MSPSFTEITPRDAHAASQDLVVRRRGVPMYVSLRSASASATGVGDPPSGSPHPADAELAEAFSVSRPQLEAPGEEETVIRTLQALAYAGLGPHRAATTADHAPADQGPAAPRPLSTDLGVSTRGTESDLRAGHYLRVVNYHNTPASWKDELVAELRGYAKDFESVEVDDLERFARTGVWHKSRPGLLPVFYEGYRDNYDVAAAACEEAGVVGWFFVCTAFVDTPVDAQYDYALAHRIKLVPENPRGERLAMTWDEIADLHRRGHVVTPHTASHALARKVLAPEDIEREVIEPKRRMDRATGGSALCTAWLEGTSWTGESAADRALVEAGYRFVFSNTMVQRLPR
ncbi:MULTISPECIES: polysaccharide deacetylase family protein [unclassified Streptomyces]|uniref:polysaccharide deacetylase family protein n=1 Tax=unclassified Streptomyces TaxID=2593676 RepID=UPI00278C6D05|nr:MULTISPECIES: polysaccharide deacetylase family protein [unclassified Streptomyces]